MKIKKAYIRTFGCQMNIHDSEFIKSELNELGFDFTNNLYESDIVLYNTCSVREKPEKKVKSLLNEIKGLKRKNKDLFVVICGCTAQQLGKNLQEEYAFIDLVFGPDEVFNFKNLYLKAKEVKLNSFNYYDSYTYPTTKVYSINSKHAYVTVMKGCDSFCSYCIVPYLRGREKSRSLDEIINDIKSLVDKGVNSITLLAQNISRYKSESNTLVELLYKISSEVKGLKKLSFLTSHPKDFDKRLINCFKDISILSPLLHLPAQHGSNKILKSMKRAYTREYYLDLVKTLQESSIWESLNFTTDIIIGFPGEDEADFHDLLSLLQVASFDNSFTFIYSPRQGTSAYKEYGSKVDSKDLLIYKERLKTYQEKQKEISLQKNKILLDKIMEVHIESISYKDSSKFTARTFNGKVLNFKNPKKIDLNIGDYANVLITSVSPTHLSGEFVAKC